MLLMEAMHSNLHLSFSLETKWCGVIFYLHNGISYAKLTWRPWNHCKISLFPCIYQQLIQRFCRKMFVLQSQTKRWYLMAQMQAQNGIGCLWRASYLRKLPQLCNWICLYEVLQKTMIYILHILIPKYHNFCFF